jgi:predicted RNA-binding Zn-ribbon protein involved in translation (DUF1610 family)
MNPFCDRHVSAPMAFKEFGAEGSTKAQAWICTVEGCKRSYSRGHGYQNIGIREMGPELNFHPCPKCHDASMYVSGQAGKNAAFWTCDACGALVVPG